MYSLVLIFISAVGLTSAKTDFTYRYGVLPSTYRAIQHVDPVNYIHYSSAPVAGAVAPIQYAATPIQYAATPIQYAATPIQYGATPIQYTATPVKTREPFHVVQYAAPVVTDNVRYVQYASPFLRSIDESVAKTTDDDITRYISGVAPNIVQYSAPIVPINPATYHKFHTQAADGSYSFGYSGGPSSRHEIRDKFGIVHGAFNYVDPEGKIQSQQYVADGLGFRVAATNLPVAPTVKLEGPKPVEETPEVKAARAEHAAFKAKKNIP